MRTAALTAALLAAPSLAAADPACDPRPNAVVADLGLHVVAAGFDRALSCHVSVQASAGLYVPWVVNRDLFGQGGGVERDLGGAMVRVRTFFLPAGEGRRGFWVSPFLQGGVVLAPRGDGRATGAAFSVGVGAGYTWALGARWLLSLGAGAQVHGALFDGSTAAPGFVGAGPHVDINVDYLL
ncbi:MAG: DUF3575 domain-containing protein [Polyangiales bacterium]